jgi:hypothetical protein
MLARAPLLPPRHVSIIVLVKILETESNRAPAHKTRHKKQTNLHLWIVPCKSTSACDLSTRLQKGGGLAILKVFAAQVNDRGIGAPQGTRSRKHWSPTAKNGTGGAKRKNVMCCEGVGQQSGAAAKAKKTQMERKWGTCWEGQQMLP